MTLQKKPIPLRKEIFPARSEVVDGSWMRWWRVWKYKKPSMQWHTRALPPFSINLRSRGFETRGISFSNLSDDLRTEG